MNNNIRAPLIAAAIIVILVVIVLFRPKTSNAPTANQNVPINVNVANPSTNTSNTNRPAITEADFTTEDLPERDSHFNFSAKIAPTWAVEYIDGSQAINFYDPFAAGNTNLDQSKIFVKYFVAKDFETLTTVDVKSRTASTISDHPAVTYVIVKKTGVANFPDQPSWRNQEHRVTDIRSSTASPATFYVFAKAPSVSDEIFDDFLKSLQFTDATTSSNVVYPLHDFLSRITKKNFGQHITPANSPVKPERFSGYHTGVDAEVVAGEASKDVPVFAIADGVIKVRRTASGYGGVVIIEHSLDQETVSGVYGHVRLSSVSKKVGQSVTKAEHIGMLGTGNSSETDGERKHLHFALLKGASTDLRGYVSVQNQLNTWHTPVDWFSQHNAQEVTS